MAPCWTKMANTVNIMHAHISIQIKAPLCPSAGPLVWLLSSFQGAAQGFWTLHILAAWHVSLVGCRMDATLKRSYVNSARLFDIFPARTNFSCRLNMCLERPLSSLKWNECRFIRGESRFKWHSGLVLAQALLLDRQRSSPLLPNLMAVTSA